MRMAKNCIYILVGLFVSTIRLSAIVKETKVFDWITPQSIQTEKNISEREISDGCFLMLSDKQFNLIKDQYYYHYVYKVVSEGGVQNYSEIQITYNPAYSKFYFHPIYVYRNHQKLDYKHKTKIKEIEREEQLEDHLYNELKTVYINLEDIRPGDVIEYEYTIEGTNPIFDKKIYDNFSYNLSYELLHFYFRLIKPLNRNLNIQYHQNDFKPVVRRLGSTEEWIWEKNNIAGIEAERNTPFWYNTYPFVEISEYNSWKNVEDWGIKVFASNEPLSDSIKTRINEIKAQYKRTDSQLMAAERLVQKGIRYYGVEIGINSHKPFSPNKVYKQRYGDCKDKALLLCRILRELGYEAYPALVSTQWRKTLREYLPSPNLFDHVIVKAIAYGNEYWFDPTITFQGGDIHNYYVPNYGLALVLDNKSTNLETIPFRDNSSIHIDEYFDVKDLAGNATLKVVSSYSGVEADKIRYRIASNSLKEMQKSYLDFYKKRYADITSKKDMYFQDDDVNNFILVSEEYTIKDFWTKADTSRNSNLDSEFSAFEIIDALSMYKSRDTKRTTPLFLEYPLKISQKVFVKLPKKWSISNENTNYSSNFFKFDYQVNYANNQLILTYEYQNKATNVPASLAGDFLKQIDKVKYLCNYKIAYLRNTPSSYGVNWLLLMLFIVFLSFTIWLCFHLLAQKRKLEESEALLLLPRTIGGWLILPIIGLCFTPIMTIKNFLQGDYLNQTSWIAVTTPGTLAYRPLWGPLLIFDLIGISFFICFPLLLLWLIFQNDSRVPKYTIFFLISTLIYSSMMWAGMISLSLQDTSYAISAANQLGRSFLSAVVWIPYFLYSKRVKETFIL